MIATIRVGQRVPPARLGRLEGGDVVSYDTERLLAGRKAVVIGVPGAQTPVCSLSHVPEFVANAAVLKAAGFDLVVCVAPNDPWVLDAWAARLDPDNQVMFLSDGNLELGRKLGLTTRQPQMYLGERLCRFMLIVKNAVVERVNVEKSVLLLSCTRAEDVLLAD